MSSSSDENLHRCLLHLHAHALIETHGGVVALPDIERDAVAADRTGIVVDVIV